ncbi:MAG TPA: DUF983 domain-containing protein [Anaerolineae bacterium]|nr:DUF983 domain-containing protein [Anaerolineae bacterium]
MSQAKPISASKALAKGLCPRCRQEKIFSSFVRMNKACSQCGTVYEREMGYYLMAVTIAYAMEVILLAPLLLYLFFSSLSVIQFAAITIVGVIVVAPFAFRWSRILWLHIDQFIHPREEKELPLPPRVDELDFTLDK